MKTNNIHSHIINANAIFYMHVGRISESKYSGIWSELDSFYEHLIK